MNLKFEAPPIRDLNGNGRLPSVDLPRMQVPLVPPPVPDIDEHRQMRELGQKLANGKDTIASSELADAFDRFAYGE
jgi:hypothetical protein